MASRSPTTTRAGRRPPLRVEPLEGRDVPTAVFTVTTAADVVADDGKLSLREAIGRANEHPGPDVVVLGTGIYQVLLGEDLAGDNSGGDFDIAGPVTIRGQGANRTVLDGGGQQRIFEVIGKAAVAFSGLTLRNGVGLTDGGAIRAVDGDLRLTGCVVSGNSAVQGGGIRDEHGAVTLIRSVVSGNVTRGNGGGLCLDDGELVLVSSTVGRNLAGGSGGGIFTVGSATLTDSGVSGNSALGFNACGGGIFAGGSATLTRTGVSGNSARGLPGSSVVLGGGVFAGGTATLTGSTVSGNSASLDGGGVVALGTATLTGSTVSGNSAVRFGGGILAEAVLRNCTVNGNFAGTRGGGIYAGPVATLANCTVSGNAAGEEGGGIYAATATLVNVTVTQNSAHRGGGLFHESGSGAFSLTNTIVAGNLVDFAGTGRDIAGDFASRGHNLIGDPTGGTGLSAGVNGDLVGQFDRPLDPRLGPLADNGGPTQTHALLAGSPAIDHGGALDPTGPPLRADQRGRPRARDGNGDGRAVIDIGAFER